MSKVDKPQLFRGQFLRVDCLITESIYFFLLNGQAREGHKGLGEGKGRSPAIEKRLQVCQKR